MVVDVATYMGGCISMYTHVVDMHVHVHIQAECTFTFHSYFSR